MPFRITTWNVNGIRNPFGYQPWREKRTFQAMFDILEADIVVIQETKIQRKDLKDDMVLVPGWDVHFSLPKHKKGYSGVAIYTRNATCCPVRAEEGITGVLCPPGSSTKFRDLPEHEQIGGYPRSSQLSSDIDAATLDSEGRCVILEFPSFVLIGTYSPANRDASRDDFRLGFLEALDARTRNLIAAGKQVVLTGDLNVIRSGLDTCNVSDMLRKEDMTIDAWQAMPSRRIINQLIFDGDVAGERDEGREHPVMWDICRLFHPGRQGMFTCWDTKRNTRPANNGSRIDYVLCSEGLRDWVTNADIQEGLHGSDHCPVYATFADKLTIGHEQVHFLDGVNPPGMVQSGRRLREWSIKDLLPMSARLIPEFDRRRSIRDMFTKKSSAQLSTAISNESAGISNISVSSTPFHNGQHSQDALDGSSLAATSPRQPVEISTLSSPRSSYPSAGDAAKSDSKLSLKRSADALPASSATLKKNKSGDSRNNSNRDRGGKMQSSLQSFFRPQASSTGADERAPITAPGDVIFMKPANGSTTPRASNLPPISTPTRHVLGSLEKVFDPIEAKESWSKLQLGQRVVPKCEHGEPCISLMTKKAGINCDLLPSDVNKYQWPHINCMLIPDGQGDLSTSAHAH